MAAATVTNTDGGYLVTGDTGIAVVSAYRIRVKSFTFVPNAANDSVALTNAKGVDVYTMKAAAAENICDHFDGGTPFEGLNVTLSASAAKLYIQVV